MSTFLIILLAVITVYVIWRLVFGKNFLEKRNERLVWRYIEDNMFRISHITDTISHCDTIEELKSIEKWVYETADKVATQIGSEAAFLIDGDYGVRVSVGIVQTIREKYDEKLNSL